MTKASLAFYDSLDHFSPNEFSAPEMMDVNLLTRLDAARAEAGVAFVITSSFRPKRPTQEKVSAHNFGKAVDIDVTDSMQRNLILRAVLNWFRRVGIYYSEHEGHIHVDVATPEDDPRFVEDVTWVDESK